MLAVGPATRIYLAGGATDLRLGYNGLYARIKTWKGDPLAGDLFVFCNRRREAVKIFFWDGSGMCLFSKRLEAGTYRWPGPESAEVAMSGPELQLLLAGIDLAGSKRRKWWRRNII